MRPHGRASISAVRPRALGICQRCGFQYNHDQLQWQFEYGAQRLINLRILVCPVCIDKPQIQLRTILLPPDPIPIEYPVPENYASADNPYSGVGFSPTDLTAIRPSSFGTMNIGTINGQAGMNAVWDGNLNKQSWRSAIAAVSNSSFQNFVGKWWNAVVATNAAQSIQPPAVYSVSSFSVTAASDQPLLQSGATGIQLQGSLNGVSWVTLYSTTTSSAAGATVTSFSSNFLDNSNYQYHRVAIQGDGTQIAVAQVQFSVANTGQNEQ